MGWAIQGCNGGTQKSTWLNIHTCDCERKYNELHQLIKDNFHLEATPEKSILSKEDAKSIELLKNSCRKVGERYEVALLWKTEMQQLPESYNHAYKRLMCLQAKFRKNPSLRNVLQSQVDNLLQKGYAIKLSEAEIKETTTPVWYLPIFIATNPNKPDKVRLV